MLTTPSTTRTLPTRRANLALLATRNPRDFQFLHRKRPLPRCSSDFSPPPPPNLSLVLRCWNRGVDRFGSGDWEFSEDLSDLASDSWKS
ncbi:hypothetical protein OPV22_005396 [Ensete ventricosum]|uniref:Uncharacterized protein n=1 Tax=Ensete ventricosum TaxID=4639 RepID=A0AAV8RRE6_ENSVE|nr:hypothetical protein OPV22_005396 [Ensete ventricosum]